jgi:NADH dehydrogenase (ubiquinone) 1 alpha subcomplex subunit 2
MNVYMLTNTLLAEFGNEKSQSLEGLTDKQIEDTVSGLVSKA